MTVCDACMDEASALYQTDAGQTVCVACLMLTLTVERDAARKRLQEAVEALRELVAATDAWTDWDDDPSLPPWDDIEGAVAAAMSKARAALAPPRTDQTNTEAPDAR